MPTSAWVALWLACFVAVVWLERRELAAIRTKRALLLWALLLASGLLLAPLVLGQRLMDRAAVRDEKL